MDGRLVNDVAVLGRAAGVLAGVHHQGAGVAEDAFPPGRGNLSKAADGQVTVDGLGVVDTQIGKIQAHYQYLPMKEYGAARGCSRSPMEHGRNSPILP
ncbi:hypothetical protein SDC9_201964 [bioreactor metagenome]|uniref:Uncharacterized protein n=1 Tax=bioreactor metagenome TaxID=1076179 RepID=A0A645J1C1_9ZZZZ